MKDWFEEEEEFDVDIPEDEPLYPLNIVSRLLDMHTWTINELIKEGILQPKMMGPRKKLFCYSDLKRLKYVKHLIEVRGVNVHGVKVIFEMHQEYFEEDQE